MYTQEEIIQAWGPYSAPKTSDADFIQSSIRQIEQFPADLNHFYQQLNGQHQEACYRPGGWSFRQVIHHLADSHAQAFTRFKLSLTEELPHIKPYSQNGWASTPDSVLADAGISVQLIDLLHQRWLVLLNHMSFDDFNKSYFHPEHKTNFTLGFALGLYAWHGKHHLTQMQRFASNQSWIAL